MILGEGIGSGWTIRKSCSKISLDAKNNNFYQWLVGFVDGKGKFIIKKNKKNYELIFKISEYKSNIKILYFIKRNIGYGSIKENNNLIISFNISNLNILKNLIIPIFDKYSLLTYKYFEYIKFKKVLEILTNSTLSQDLKNYLILNIINNNISPILESKNLNKYWLIGFIEAKGNFIINEDYKISFSIIWKEEDKILYKIKKLLHIPSNIEKIDKDKRRIITSNSRVIGVIIKLLKNKLKGIKSLEYKLWSKAKFYKDKKEYKKYNKILLISKNIIKYK